MRKSVFLKIVVVAMMLSLSAGVGAAEAAAAQTSCPAEKNLCNMGRGIVNIVTCWLEVPRCLVYYNSQLPVLGAVVGAVQGAGFTATRAFAGVADFASFGFMTDSIYKSCHGFEEYVGESRWVPKQ